MKFLKLVLSVACMISTLAVAGEQNQPLLREELGFHGKILRVKNVVEIPSQYGSSTRATVVLDQIFPSGRYAVAIQLSTGSQLFAVYETEAAPLEGTAVKELVIGWRTDSGIKASDLVGKPIANYAVRYERKITDAKVTLIHAGGVTGDYYYVQLKLNDTIPSAESLPDLVATVGNKALRYAASLDPDSDPNSPTDAIVVQVREKSYADALFVGKPVRIYSPALTPHLAQ